MQENVDDGPEFTDEALRATLKRVGRDARQESFAAGRSVIFVKGTVLVALNADGTERIVEPLIRGAEVGANE
jgi:hypothetical protein